ncbi:MAG: N-acetylglucosamine-6-phosphate deacetylase [Clostridia bacterium]|nr:N-acetylglucosamine-6-phosphate deacetylase [Clostridia bacterium]
MITKIKSDRIILPGGILDGYICFDGGTITYVGTDDAPCDEYYDLTGKYVSPGFIDIHTHGAVGTGFLTDNPAAVGCACNYHLSHGTTSIMPTLSASPIEEMASAVATIGEAIEYGFSDANILGAHLEGPYLSTKQSGAQCADFITPPIKEAYEELIAKHGKYIARWTYAPENDESGEFADFNVNNDILLSAGHTDAKYPDIDRAISHGCRLITHLYSCTSTVTRNMGFRSLGVIESAFLRDELYVEIIADGKHLPKELVQMIVKIKGEDKVILITDSLEITGTNIKEGVMAGTPFIVEDGVCKLRDRSAFAGSVATADVLIRFVAFECGLGIESAVKMMTATPAALLGINKGNLAVGYDADIIAFDDDVKIKTAFVGGKRIF